MTAFAHSIHEFEQELAAITARCECVEEPEALLAAALACYETWGRHGAYGAWRDRADAIALALCERAGLSYNEPLRALKACERERMDQLLAEHCAAKYGQSWERATCSPLASA